MAKYQAPRRKKKSNKGLIAACVILGLFVAVLAAAFIFFRSYYGLSNYMSDADAMAQAQAAHLDEATLSAIDMTGLTDSEADALKSSQDTSSIDVFTNKDLYNLLLVGVDRRDTSWNGNSDSIILLSINSKTKKMTMMSFMRDLYAEIEGYGVRKLNAACAIGGPTLLVKTIEQNYKVDIDNYACVDFVAMASIIDYAGGVEITVSEEEATTANGLIMDMCNTQNIDYSTHLYNGAGTYNADGWMAVGYARIRYVGNSDYERTERQRTVLTNLTAKFKNMSVTELNTFVREVLPLVTHNITSGKMLSLVTSVPDYMTYTMTQSRVPFDNMYTIQGEILVPTEPDTINQIQTVLNA